MLESGFPTLVGGLWYLVENRLEWLLSPLRRMTFGSDVLADDFARGDAETLSAVGLPNSGCGDKTCDSPFCFAGGLEAISMGDFSSPVFGAAILA